MGEEGSFSRDDVFSEIGYAVYVSGYGEWRGGDAEDDFWDEEFEFSEGGVEEGGVAGFVGVLEDDCEV